MLNWLEDPETFRSGRPDREWSAFSGICRDRYRFDPESDGPIRAALLLGQRDGEWASTWARFAEAPDQYPSVIDALRRARPREELALPPDSWPQQNEDLETRLGEELRGLAKLDPETARDRILDLEREHGHRREWVWAKLGLSRRAGALKHLALLAETTRHPLAGKTVVEVMDSYSSGGWRTDLAALDALSEVSGADVGAVRGLVRSIYRPWLEAGATAFQSAYASNPAGYVTLPEPDVEAGTCVMFTDGLRYDTAIRLTEFLRASEIDCAVTPGLAALPTVTATGKPSVSPAAGSVSECSPRPQEDAVPVWPDSGTKVIARGLRDAIAKGDIQILSEDEDVDPSGRAWTEFGNIDESGTCKGRAIQGCLEGRTPPDR